MKLYVQTVILSDIHLGTPDCKIDEVNHFLQYVHCRKLILNGDIIDGWQLMRSGKWTAAHSRFVRLVLKKVERRDTEVIYLRGNHDDVLSSFTPLNFGRLQIREDYIHETPRGRYLVLHGDVFDSITRNFVFLAHLGDWGYSLLLRINRLYNAWRTWCGREYYSLSKAIKARVKSAVNHISSFEHHLVRLAKEKGCVGIICGHIHTAADKQMEGIHYLNSGDWVESLTAIVERLDGTMEILNYQDFIKEYPVPSKREEEPAELVS